MKYDRVKNRRAAPHCLCACCNACMYTTHEKNSYVGYCLSLSFSRRATIDHTRLRLGFPCLREYQFKLDRCTSPICHCGLDSESTKHFFLLCPRYAAQRYVLLTSVTNIFGEQ